MLMKYKDFKQMSNEDMKQIVGGILPKIEDPYKCCVGTSTTDCGSCSVHPNCVSGATAVKC